MRRLPVHALDPNAGDPGQVPAITLDGTAVEWATPASGGTGGSAADVTYAGSADLVATNVEAALDELDTEKVATSELGAANGVATLGADGKVPSAQLPTSSGGTGETAWTAPTFQNSWVNYGGAFATAGYRKDSNGVVHLKGTVKSGTVNQPMFTLPAGYRPPAIRGFATVSNGLLAQLNVYPDGTVVLSIGSNAGAYLDGVTFYDS